MLATSYMSRSIRDASWGKFIEYLSYQAEWSGKNIIKIGRFDPSTKMCNICGYINNNIKLSDRKWECPRCNIIHDRDINAAINIRNFAFDR